LKRTAPSVKETKGEIKDGAPADANGGAPAAPAGPAAAAAAAVASPSVSGSVFVGEAMPFADDSVRASKFIPGDTVSFKVTRLRSHGAPRVMMMVGKVSVDKRTKRKTAVDVTLIKADDSKSLMHALMRALMHTDVHLGMGRQARERCGDVRG
jgi:hypothetical protein